MAELQKIDVVVGTGAEARSGTVKVHYTGWLHDPAQAGPADAHAPTPAPQPQAPQPAVDAAAKGAKFVNPVCGVAVDMATPKHVEHYDGVAYYFCCDCCLTTFRQDPAKFAAIHRASAGRIPA